MNEIIHRVFVTITPSEDFLKKLNRQTGHINGCKLLAAVSLGVAVLSEIECRKQEETIYQLSVRVKKLENREGE